MRNSNWKGHGTGGLEENSLKRLDPADEKMIMTAWVKRCITWEVEGIRQRGRPKKMVGLCCPKRMRSPGINGEGELRGATG